jgi:hypothetical protein
MITAMEYRPVRTMRELWRLDTEAFHAGYSFAETCDLPVNPMRVGRSYYLGWVHGSHDQRRLRNGDVEATRADMDLNMGHSECVH